MLVHEIDGHGTLADGGRHATHSPLTHVAGRENARHVGLQQVWVPSELPAPGTAACAKQVWSLDRKVFPSLDAATRQITQCAWGTKAEA